LKSGTLQTARKPAKIAEIPRAWEVVRLGQLYSERKEKGVAGLPVMSVTLDRGLVPRSSLERRVESELSPADHALVREGDLVYNMMRMWQGASGVAAADSVVSPAYVVAKPSERLLPAFAGYLLKAPQTIRLLYSYSQGITRDRLRLYFNNFAEVPIPLPPLPEQRKIAAILSSVDDAIAATRKVIEQTERVKQGLLQTLMTRGIGHTRFKKTEIGEIPEEWKFLRLDEVARVQTGFAKNSRIEGSLRDLPYLRVANVQDGHLDLSEVKTVSVPEGRVERHLLMSGDVLLTEGGDYDKLGRGHVWEGQISPCIHQNHVFVVRADRSKLLPDFLSALTSSSYGKRYFLRCAKQTTNLASINSTQLRSFPVLLPTLSEQSDIVQRIRAVDGVRDVAAREGERLTRFKRGLMQDLLTGRVRVPLD